MIGMMEAIKIGLTAIKWGRRVVSAASSDDGERLAELLTKEMKTTVALNLAKAEARDIALKKRRRAAQTGEHLPIKAAED